VLELPAGERAAFVARFCRDDTELRSTIDELLEAIDAAEPFLEGSVEECCALHWHEII